MYYSFVESIQIEQHIGNIVQQRARVFGLVNSSVLAMGQECRSFPPAQHAVQFAGPWRATQRQAPVGADTAAASSYHATSGIRRLKECRIFRRAEAPTGECRAHPTATHLAVVA
jgi:hypothetical protein